ncbi:MAG TPA: DUF4010 domain-containing protein [Planctomycetota bacterium]
MGLQEAFGGLGVALGIGFLIGLQREQQQRLQEPAAPKFGGVRTYSLAALLGGVCALLARPFGAWTIGAGLLALLAPLLISFADDIRRDRDRGITSEVAFLLTYLLGALALSPDLLPSPKERYLLAAAVGVAAGALLSFKKPLHSWVSKLSDEDIFATVKFAVLAVIILPLLPNKAYGRFTLNPSNIGLMVTLIAGISFAGYVAIRALGPGRGLGVVGLLGGLASSTAVTLSLSGRARREPDVAAPCAMAVVLASAVMAPRVVAEVAVVNPALVPAVAWPMAAMAAAGLVSAFLLARSAKKAAQAGEEVAFHNPFELGSALKLGAVFVVVLIVSKFAQQTLGTAGIYAAGALAGLTDVDAVTLSMANLAKQGLDPRHAAVTILIAVASNTLVKAGMTVALGGWALGRRTLPAFLAMTLAGAGGVAVLWLR